MYFKRQETGNNHTDSLFHEQHAFSYTVLLIKVSHIQDASKKSSVTKPEQETGH